jgi:ribosomal protein L11 methyltransferase
MAHKRAQDMWRVRFQAPPETVEAFETALDPLMDAFLCFEIEGSTDWQFDSYKAEKPDLPALHAAVALAAQVAGLDAIPELEIEHQAARNWLAENLTAFPPIRAGRFYVYGSHIEDPIPHGCHPLLIDAATAFGSGEHQSTYGCLLALSDLAKISSPLKIGHGRALDMGCGSGILALAMARQWKIPVVATDIDEESVRVTAYNARLNGLSQYLTAFPGDGFNTRGVKAGAPYDVICANILARPLCSMSHALSASLAPGGRVILAGLLQRQEAMVLAAYRAQGLHLIRRYPLAPWVTLVLG